MVTFNLKQSSPERSFDAFYFDAMRCVCSGLVGDRADALENLARDFGSFGGDYKAYSPWLGA